MAGFGGSQAESVETFDHGHWLLVMPPLYVLLERVVEHQRRRPGSVSDPAPKKLLPRR